VRVERRTVPGENTDVVVQEIRDVIQRCGIDADLSVVLRRAPLECPADAPLAHTVRTAAGGVLGKPPEECGVAFWMDAAVFAGAGIDTVNYGPTGAGAHAVIEWVDVASVVRCARVLEGAARRFCL
jgi:acetylornithine deacetylase